MSRQKNRVKSVVVQVKFTLVPGLHDRYIAYFEQIPAKHRAATILRDLDGGMSKPAASDDDALDVLLDDLIG